MGSCICKHKINDKEYFVCDKNNNFIFCLGSNETKNDNPPVCVINKNEKLLSYLTSNIDNPITYKNLVDYINNLNLEFNKNNEKFINLLNTEKICNNSCFSNSKFIKYYDKTQYNLIDIELNNLINLFKTNPEYSDRLNKYLNDSYNSIINNVKTNNFKNYNDRTDAEKKNMFLLTYINNLIITESILVIINSDNLIEKDKKNNFINIIKDNIILHNNLQKIIIPYIEEPPTQTNLNGLGIVAGITGSMIIIIIIVVIFVIFLINLLIYYFIGKTIGFTTLIIIIIIFSLIRTIGKIFIK